MRMKHGKELSLRWTIAHFIIIRFVTSIAKLVQPFYVSIMNSMPVYTITVSEDNHDCKGTRNWYRNNVGYNVHLTFYPYVRGAKMFSSWLSYFSI